MLVECPNCHELYDNAVDDACPKCTVTHEIVCPKCGKLYLTNEPSVPMSRTKQVEAQYAIEGN